MPLLPDELVDFVVQVPQPVFSQARVLDVHDLAPDFSNNLLPPFVCVGKVATFGSQKGASLFRLLLLLVLGL
jgi:hypothetical protein